MSMYGDPQFTYHKMMAQFWGLLGLRLADSPLLPFNHTDQALSLHKYVDSLETEIKKANATQQVTLKVRPPERRESVCPLKAVGVRPSILADALRGPRGRTPSFVAEA
jgi:hypothetical protein